MHRVFKCTGSVYLAKTSDVEPGESTEYADEGTAAHAVFHRAWLLGVEPSTMLGSAVNGFTVDQSMVEGAEEILQVVEKECERLGVGPEAVTMERYIQHPSDPDRGGTPDILIRSETHLSVVDYKYGMGIFVDVIGNSQILEYAVLAHEEKSVPLENQLETRLTVVQPRLKIHFYGTVREWDLPEGYLKAFNTRVLDRQEKVENEDIDFEVGSHCWKCPVQLHCGPMQETTMDMAAAFSGAMTPQKAGQILDSEMAIKDYINNVRDWELRRLKSGGNPVRFTLKDKRSTRKFTVSEEELCEAAQEMGVDEASLYKKVLKTPNQLTKVLGKEFVEAKSSSQSSGSKLVPLSEVPEDSGRSAKDVFAGVEADFGEGSN